MIFSRIKIPLLYITLSRDIEQLDFSLLILFTYNFIVLQDFVHTILSKIRILKKIEISETQRINDRDNYISRRVALLLR